MHTRADGVSAVGGQRRQVVAQRMREANMPDQAIAEEGYTVAPGAQGGSAPRSRAAGLVVEW